MMWKWDLIAQRKQASQITLQIILSDWEVWREKGKEHVDEAGVPFMFLKVELIYVADTLKNRRKVTRGFDEYFRWHHPPIKKYL